MYAGGGGGQDRCTFFPKFKTDQIISAKSSFYCFFIRTLLGKVREFAKRVLFVCSWT